MSYKQFVVTIEDESLKELKMAMADFHGSGSEYMIEAEAEEVIKDAIEAHKECDWGCGKAGTIECKVREIK